VSHDSRSGLLPVSASQGAAQVRHIVSNLTHGTGATTGETMYFGSPQSQTLLRIYDKRLEFQSKGPRELPGVRHSMGIGTQEGSRRAVCPSLRQSLDETDWKEFVVGLLRSYVDFRQITKDTEEEERYRAPVLDWYALLTEGFQKGRLAQEQQVQTLQNVKRWVSDTLTPMLAVICATPGGEAWLLNEIVRGIARWNDRHRNLLKQPAHSVSPVCRRSRGQPMLGGLGVSQDSPGVSAYAYRQRTFSLAQYQRIYTVPLGLQRTRFPAVVYMASSALNLRPSRPG
jgi:hypothetical protein